MNRCNFQPDFLFKAFVIAVNIRQCLFCLDLLFPAAGAIDRRSCGDGSFLSLRAVGTFRTFRAVLAQLAFFELWLFDTFTCGSGFNRGGSSGSYIQLALLCLRHGTLFRPLFQTLLRALLGALFRTFPIRTALLLAWLDATTLRYCCTGTGSSLDWATVAGRGRLAARIAVAAAALAFAWSFATNVAGSFAGSFAWTFAGPFTARFAVITGGFPVVALVRARGALFGAVKTLNRT